MTRGTSSGGERHIPIVPARGRQGKRLTSWMFVWGTYLKMKRKKLNDRVLVYHALGSSDSTPSSREVKAGACISKTQDGFLRTAESGTTLNKPTNCIAL